MDLRVLVAEVHTDDHYRDSVIRGY
jgi:hypothetical protein